LTFKNLFILYFTHFYDLVPLLPNRATTNNNRFYAPKAIIYFDLWAITFLLFYFPKRLWRIWSIFKRFCLL